MGPKMQPKVVSREIVKPSSSTPKKHPAFHNLSFFDQILPPYYVPLLLFYSSSSNKNGENDHLKSSSRVLKTSLSTALSHYYPLAGRIKDYATVDCNGEGALFLEAQMECTTLSEFFTNFIDENLRLLFPDSLFWKDSSSTGPVTIQITYFKCGGMSIGLCLCHKMMDMASMSSFVYDWASLARDSGRKITCPKFTIGSLYPPLDIPILKTHIEEAHVDRNDCVSRRLVFYGSKIAELKAIVADQVPNPTRVEVVAALLYKSAIKATARARSSSSTEPSVMNHAINLRTLVSPRLSKRNKGNAIGVFSVLAPESKEVKLEWLVEEFRRSKTQFASSCANTRTREELCLLTLKSMKQPNDERDMYNCTSWCRNPFYECDFGWGKPLWVATILCLKLKNVVCLIDTREGGGIEVFVSMEEKVMAMLEHDEELISFCSINPSVLNSNLCV